MQMTYNGWWKTMGNYKQGEMTMGNTSYMMMVGNGTGQTKRMADNG